MRYKLTWYPVFVSLTPLPWFCLCSNISHYKAYPDHPISNCKPHPWNSLPCSISVLFTIAFIPGILSIHLCMYINVCVCTWTYIHVCTLFPLCNVLTSCYNNVWIIVGTQIYVILLRLVCQPYPTPWQYIKDIKEFQWLSSFPTKLRASTFGNDTLMNYTLFTKVLN